MSAELEFEISKEGGRGKSFVSFPSFQPPLSHKQQSLCAEREVEFESSYLAESVCLVGGSKLSHFLVLFFLLLFYSHLSSSCDGKEKAVFGKQRKDGDIVTRNLSLS